MSAIVGAWNGGPDPFAVNAARVHVYASGAMAKYIKFTQLGTTNRDSWFARQKIAETSWPSLLNPFFPTNFFSIAGDADHDRRWFVNNQFNTCAGDAGFLVLSGPLAGCTWETDHGGPTRILFAGGEDPVNWQSDPAVTEGDTFAVFVR